jgi:hypothetical protein
MELFGFEARVLSIEGLILAKRAAGHPKDLLVLPELEAMQETLLKQLDEVNRPQFPTEIL